MGLKSKDWCSREGPFIQPYLLGVDIGVVIFRALIVFVVKVGASEI
jgi:hypothetical protein